MSRRVLERPEYRKLFESFHSSMFRLETRNRYDVPFEKDSFQRFLKGERVVPDEGDREWQRLISAHRTAGRLWQKVHVVDLPLSDYLRFEIATSYDVFSPFGEEVSMIERRQGSVTDHFDDQDFWLFDDSVLVLMHYSDDDQVLARELVVDEPELTAAFVVRKEEALKAAIPYTEFCAKATLSLR
jgi:hypothetical protein